MQNEKELAVVKIQANKALSAVNELIIKTTDDYAKADEIRGKIKQVGKMIKEKKEEITKPINESLKHIRDLFKPIETTHEQAIEIIDTKMISFRRSEDARIEKEKQKIADKVETGYMKPETAVAKIGVVGDTKSNLKEAGVKTSIRRLPRARITSEKDIPREYLVVNERLILEALKSGKQVSGAELYYEEIIA
jgi:seryl-tRNA synthetase